MYQILNFLLFFNSNILITYKYIMTNFDKDILHHTSINIIPNMDKFMLDIKNKKYSMLSYERLENLRKHCEQYSNLENIIAIECGCANGGSLILMRKYLPKAKIYGFDSWDKMPDLTIEDEHELRAIKKNFINKNTKLIGKTFGNIESVRNNFTKLNISMNNVFLIKGYFDNTFTKKNLKNINNIAILRLDVDWYKATLQCLETFYDKVIDGGVIIIDDFYAYKGCRKAVIYFRKKYNIQNLLYHTCETGLNTITGGTEVYWYK